MPRAERAEMVRTCALRVAARHGIDNTNHTLVASEAAVSAATVFFYFPTQLSLLEAVLDDVSAFLLDDIIRQAIVATDTVPAAIERMLLQFAESIDARPDMARVWLDWSTAVRPEIWRRYLAFHGQACGVIAGLVANGQRDGSLQDSVDIDDAAHVIVGLGHMVAHMKFAGSPNARVHRAVHGLVAHYISRR